MLPRQLKAYFLLLLTKDTKKDYKQKQDDTNWIPKIKSNNILQLILLCYYPTYCRN